MKPHPQTETWHESDAIRADIDQTRECMDQTLNELGERIKPRHLVDEALGLLHLEKGDTEKLKEQAAVAAHAAGAAAGRAAHAIADAVQQHPIPTLLIGAGVAWAVYEARHHNGQEPMRSHAYDAEWSDRTEEEREEREYWQSGGLKEKAAEALTSAKEGIQSAKETLTDKVSAAGEQMQEKGRRIRQRASQGARTLGRKVAQGKDQLARSAQRGYEIGRAKFIETSQAHPLSVGLGFLAAGVLIGLALPPSHKEDQWVGEAADRMKERAKETGEDLVQRGKHVATAAAEAAKKTASEEGLTPQALKEKVQHVAAETQQAAKRSAEEQGLPSNSAPEQPGTNPAQPS